jgi:hypothetical protein
VNSGVLTHPSHEVEVSSGEDDAPKADTLAAKQKVPDGGDAEGEGVSSAKPIAPSPISSNVSEQAEPSIADRVAIVAPSINGQKQKRPPPIPNRKQSKSLVDQVMTQIELPPYRRPRSPLDLVPIEIIFGCLFEAFQHASQVVSTGTSVGDDTQPPKKTRAPSLKKILVPR